MKKFILYTCASLALLNGSVTLQAMEAGGTADVRKPLNWAEQLWEKHEAQQAREKEQRQQQQQQQLAKAREAREARTAERRLAAEKEAVSGSETEEEKQPREARLKEQGSKEAQEKERMKKEPTRWLKPTIAAGTALLITGALYAGLKWYQRRRIVRTLARHTIKLITLTPTQKDALAAAFKAGYRVPGSLRNLARLAQKADFVSSAVPAETMWRVAAELYYRAVPTEEQVAALKAMMRA
jgi:hypothetical protein